MTAAVTWLPPISSATIDDVRGMAFSQRYWFRPARAGDARMQGSGESWTPAKTAWCTTARQALQESRAHALAHALQGRRAHALHMRSRGAALVPAPET